MSHDKRALTLDDLAGLAEISARAHPPAEL
jgi:hypothetical protein